MTINKRLNITSPHKNGNVGFESVINSDNASRVNALFDNSFTSITSSVLAERFLKGRSEFNNATTLIAGEARATRIAELEANILTLTESSASSQLILSRENELASLRNLTDVTLDEAEVDSDQAALDQAANDASENFNPDFDLNTISFVYNKDSFTTNDRSEYFNTDLERKFPVLNPGQGESSQGTAIEYSKGGFGNDSNKGTVAEGILSSTVFLAKYS